MNLVEKIKKYSFLIENNYGESVFFKVVKLDDVLAFLPDYIIIRKHGDLHGEKAVEEVIAWMMAKP